MMALRPAERVAACSHTSSSAGWGGGGGVWAAHGGSSRWTLSEAGLCDTETRLIIGCRGCLRICRSNKEREVIDTTPTLGKKSLHSNEKNRVSHRAVCRI